MKINDIKKQLQKESHHFVPDIKHKVLNSVGIRKTDKIKKRLSSPFKMVLSSSFLVLFVFVGLFIYIKNQSTPNVLTNTYVSVDINPSIELKVDEYNKVKDVRPLNLDGALLLESMDLKDKDLTIAIQMIIDLAISMDYLDESSEDEVIITAVNDNQAQENKIKLKIENDFKNNRHVLIKKSNDLTKKQAKEFDISVGKMMLIQDILKKDDTLVIEDLVKLSPKELNEILRDFKDEDIRGFSQEYGQKLKEFRDAKNEALNNHNKYFEDALSEINNIRSMIEDREQLKTVEERTKHLLETYFPEIEYTPLKNYAAFKKLLNNLENSLYEQTDLVINLINVKYDTQVKYFNRRVKDELKENTLTFDFEFDSDFSMEHINKGAGYVRKEQEALTLVEEINSLLELTKNNHSSNSNIDLQIASLMEDYYALMTSEDIREGFKGNKIIKNFESKYEQYKENKKNN